jgi:hypothetical protein
MREKIMTTEIRGSLPGRLGAALACLFLFAFGAVAQEITGRLVGTVTDPSAAGVPNADVSATNQNTGIVTKTKTDVQGNFVFPTLPAGVYTVRIEASGFRAAVVSNSQITVAGTARVDVTLQVGSVSEAVEVKAESPLVQSASSDIGQAIEKQQVQDLPLNGRIFSQLVNLVPGAVPAGNSDAPESASGAGARSQIQSQVNGVNWSGTTYTLDGVSNSEPLNAFINIAPPIEAIEEFNVQTSNPRAEFGTFGGAVVNVTLRSGTNEFHGSLFEYLRNQAMNARSFFAASKAPFKTNQFGGTIGGPIKKNKAFFFFDYQGLRLRQGVSYSINVPSAAMRQGYVLPSEGFATIYDPLSAANTANVTPFPNSQVPKSRWDPVSAQVLDIWPVENIAPSRPGPYLNYFQNVSNSQTMNAIDVKADYQFERGGRLFVRESTAGRNLDNNAPANRFMSADPDSTSRSHNAVIGHTLAIRPTLLNEVRLGFNRFDTRDFGQDYGVNENNILGIKNGNLSAFQESSGIAAFGVGSLYGFGAPGWTNAQRLANTYELTNGTTWIKGSHTFKFGFDLRKVQSTLTNPQDTARGRFTFGRDMTSQNNVGGAEYASFLLGYPSQIIRSLVNTRPAVRLTQGGAYAQDDYRVSRSLTLNLGLRWDLFTNPVEKFNRQVNFNPTTGKFNGATSDNRGPNVDNYYKNFAPRFGFAFAPGNAKTAIRGAIGISYFSYNYGATGGTLERNFPLFQTFQVGPTVPDRPFAQVAVDGLPNFVPTPLAPVIDPVAGIQPFYIPQGFRPAVITMYNVGVQRQITDSSSVEVAYVGTAGAHLYRNRDIDTPVAPGPGAFNDRRIYYGIAPLIQSIIERGANGVSRYNSMQVKFTHRMSRGLQALVSYTLAQSKDDTSIFWVWDDTRNFVPNSTDFRQIMTVSWTYDLPFGTGRQFLTSAPKAVDLVAGGWSVNGITWMRTGSPMSVTVANNLLNTGTGNYANLTCSGVNYPKRVEQWFDTSCFADPTQPYVFGNAIPGTLRGPGVVNFDLSAFKAFHFTERRYLEFRAEAFNAFNNPHFANPATSRSSGNYGRVTGTTLTPREIQLGLRLMF